jgi:hypothetical protein
MITKPEKLAEVVSAVRLRRKAQAAASPAKSGWKTAFGSVKDGDLFREAARLGDAYRKRENQKR